MKVLVFGKDGQVGRELLARLPEAIAFGRAEANFEEPDMIADIVRQERPDVIVNAAAYTAVDAAEDDRERAWTVNAAAVGAIGEAAKQNDALVIHYSTDYVYPGTAPGAVTEAEATSPMSVYGASKLAGEVLLRDSGARHVTLRTSWVYAPQGKNFPLTILRLAKERETLNVVADQIGAPTPADLIADVTTLFMVRPVTGLYHLAPRGETSWHGLATFLVAEALAAGAELKLRPEAIKPIAAKDYPAKAPRPANSRLDSTKLGKTLGIALPPWQEGVSRLIKTLIAEGRL